MKIIYNSISKYVINTDMVIMVKLDGNILQIFFQNGSQEKIYFNNKNDAYTQFKKLGSE